MFRSFLFPKFAVTALALGLLASANAFAGTVTFGSYGGSTAPAGLSNTPVTFSNAQGTGTASTVGQGLLTPISGTQYVSYDPNTFASGVNDPVETTTYTTTFTGNLAGSGGILYLSADDAVSATLNGVLIGSTAGTGYDTIVGPLLIGNGIYQNGLNTFVFSVSNNGGPTDLDFRATAVTPEPSSLLMLGTGILGVAGSLRRRFAL